MVTQLDNYEFEIFKKFSSHEAYPIAEEWLAHLKNLPGITDGEVSGELRRGKYSIDHIDLVLAVSDLASAHDRILDALFPVYIQAENEEFITTLLPSGIKMIVWLTPQAQYACKLLRITGSESHIDQLARLAARKGLKLEPGGLLNSGKTLEIHNEEEIYAKLGLPWIPPELRENSTDLSNPGALDMGNLIKLEDILSDLHVHSIWSDGKGTTEEMAAAAIARNFTHMAFCDHSPLLMKKYSDASYFSRQALEIDTLQKQFHNGFTILKGVEVDILPDGSLDLPDEILRKMDIVVASMHVALDQPLEIATNRLIRAIEHPLVNIIGHPGGRIYPMVDLVDLDWERVYRAAAYNQVALEINSHKSHPIFDENKARAAGVMGTILAIDSDSHNPAMMSNSCYGLAIARRAGLKSDQVINTWSLSHLKLWLNHKRELTLKAR